MRRHLIILLFGLSLVGSATSAAAEDWNFTPTNYNDLMSGGGDLTYASDSDWFPQELKDNLKTTLKQALDPKTQPRNTDGVNTKDFYHGHVVCPKPCTDAQTNAIEAWNKAEKAAKTEGMGKEYPTITKEKMAKWKDTMKKVQAAAAAALKSCLKEGCGVVYHTYEENTPKGMKYGDPRRNLYTPNGAGGKPTGFTPPDEGNASSYMQNYCVVLQFAFLVDSSGKIHVTTGTKAELSAITGVPPGP